MNKELTKNLKINWRNGISNESNIEILNKSFEKKESDKTNIL